MTYADLTGTTIRHAAVRGARLDDLAERRRTERLLEHIPASVSGMNASSVLCVREMSVHVRSRARHMQSDGSILGEEMERLARYAARPAHGPVPLHAEAVLFVDRAELLSCLARDHVRHQLAQGWWWRVLLNTPDLPIAAARLWVTETAHVPAALERLARTSDAVDFVHMLGEAEANAVAQAVVRAYGLALLSEDATIASLLYSQPDSPALVKAQQDSAHASTRALERQLRAALPEAWTPGLSGVQRCLLAVGLSLVRLPNLVRTAAYAQALPALLAQAAAYAIETAQRNHHSVGAGPEMTADETSVHLARPLKRQVIGDSGENRLQSPTDRHTGSVGAEPVVRQAHHERPHEPSVLTMNAAPGLTATTVPALPASLMDGDTDAVRTQFGGVFFLCNAALVLGLYPDFTRPLERGLELSLWDFLAFAAADLGGPAVRRDPLWHVLAELAGRMPGQRPGAGFAPPREWRLPVDWLLPFAGDAADWTWEADAARLVVRHPAGFVVLDLPHADMAIEEQLHVELTRYDMPGIRPAVRSRRGPVMPIARWRSWVMSYLGRRVARALGDARWQRACRSLLCLPGRIERDAGRVDVHYSLEQLPVAVRMAGLDRDPGWIPAAGRDLRFHFGCDHD